MNHLKRSLLICALLSFTLGHAQDIHSGDALLRAMHDRYQSSWYRTLTFTQKSTNYKPDGTSSAETWHEAALLPGKLRIDIGPATNGNGYVLVDGTATTVKDGKVSGTVPLVNMLLVLGFDVYTQDPDITREGREGRRLRSVQTPRRHLGRPSCLCGWRRQRGSDVEAVLGRQRHVVVCARD